MSTVAQRRVLLALDRVEHGPDQPRLADPSLADQQHRSALAPGGGLPPALEHERELLVTPDHGRWAARPPGLEAAAGRALAHDPEGHQWLGEALEPGRPERAQVEHLAQEMARALRHHHRAGLRRLLQPGGEVRRLADHRLLRAAPSPTKSPTTTRPVAIPIRPRAAPAGVASRSTTSAIASPAWTARSASSSCARGKPK